MFMSVSGTLVKLFCLFVFVKLGGKVSEDSAGQRWQTVSYVKMHLQMQSMNLIHANF